MADRDYRFRAIERIQKLIELAGSANENEARNAAVQACKMIRDQKVELYPAGLVRPADPAQAIGKETYNGAASFVSTIRDIVGGAANAAKTAKEAKKDIDDLFAKGKQVPLGDAREAPMRRRAKYANTCKDCGERIEAGDEVWFRVGVGAVHAFKCRPEVLV